MATFRRRGAKRQAQIRFHGHPAMSRTFTTKRDAEVWARQIEASIERGDLPGSLVALKTVTLIQVLERYEATVTPLKKGKASEHYRLRVLRNHPIARLSLDKLALATVTIHRDERLRSVSASAYGGNSQYCAAEGHKDKLGRGNSNFWFGRSDFKSSEWSAPKNRQIYRSSMFGLDLTIEVKR